MQREIRARAWFEDSKTWGYYTFGNIIDNSIKEMLNDAAIGGLTWYQFTGLKDKNGKEIYEGDIVNGNPWNDHCSVYIIVFEVAEYLFKEIKGNQVTGFHNNNNLQVKVIGNIYETPELLKQ